MTRIYLITGFLGSGKTTFLQKYLEKSHVKTGVLMNEFGQVSIDTSLIKREEMNFVELTNGSIFCSCLKTDFIDGLINLAGSGLDLIYVESSGLSDPSNVTGILELVEEKSQSEIEFCGTICLVDGLYFFEELEKLVAVEKQIKHSHLVLINKCDLIDEGKIEAIKSKVLEINARALIYPTVNGWAQELDLIGNVNFSFVIGDEETSNTEETKPKTYSLKLKDTVVREELLEFLESVCGGFYRIKGLVEVGDQLLKVDSVGAKIDIRLATESEEMQFNENLETSTLVFLASDGLKSFRMLVAKSQEIFGSIGDISV